MGDNIYLESLALSNYRSFGEIQYFPSFKQINVIIGQNNSGKSNLLKFIYEHYSNITHNSKVKIDQSDKHLFTNKKLSYGYFLDISPANLQALFLKNFTLFNVPPAVTPGTTKGLILASEILNGHTDSANENNKIWLYYDADGEPLNDELINYISIVSPINLKIINTKLTQNNQIKISSENTILKLIKAKHKTFKAYFIPAYRKIGNAEIEIHENFKTPADKNFDGEDLITKLSQLQNPTVYNQPDKLKFKKINEFLKFVTGNETASIEIPHNRQTILVNMDDKVLPLDSLGTGIHEVIILASASTIIENSVICMEEPELHLNPILQKKLIRYLKSTNNQYFISTHSAALIDTPNSKIYHVVNNGKQSVVENVSNDKHRSAICSDLGYHPSDLLQTNCIIWVEGPSDRIYLNYWIKGKDENLIEGIHYSIMFYGGKLLSHLNGESELDEVEGFISLLRLNRRSTIVLDRDRSDPTSPLNDSKQRIITEFEKGDGFAWITAGREIENYLNPEQVEAAINKAHPNVKIVNQKMEKYENTLKIINSENQNTSANKVKVAHYITEENETPDYAIHDLDLKINLLITFILDSNPKIRAI